MLIPSRALHPASQPFAKGVLPVSGGHCLAYSQSGNPDGVPVVYLHGGPGGSSLPRHRQFFDPRRFHIIQFDQRGCGESTPSGALHANTTWHLVRDIEALRKKLGIEQWMVAGGSWGTTLGLAYAEQHPERVRAMLFRGIWLSRAEDMAWIYAEGGASKLFPGAWDDFTKCRKDAEKHDARMMLGALNCALDSRQPEDRIDAVRRFMEWSVILGFGSPERAVQSGLIGQGSPMTAQDVANAKLELLYDFHGCFLDENPILEHIGSITHIPAIVIHGAADMLCHPSQAEDLANAWGNHCQLRLVPHGPHFDFDPLIGEAMTAAADELGEILAAR